MSASARTKLEIGNRHWTTSKFFEYLFFYIEIQFCCPSTCLAKIVEISATVEEQPLSLNS